MAKRLYKSGSTWALWRWTITDSEYIIRLHLAKTPWFAICLHWLMKPDPEPYLHDHPVTFLSLILRGGYTELRKHMFQMPKAQRNRWFNWVRASAVDRHTIIYVEPKTLTLAVMGPKTREWGYHTPNGWVYWKTYFEAKRKGIQL